MAPKTALMKKATGPEVLTDLSHRQGEKIAANPEPLERLRDGFNNFLKKKGKPTI
ncbi:MAG: hypothetical protein WCX64_02740 [Candidatus Micrarchaeia archaeon]